MQRMIELQYTTTLRLAARNTQTNAHIIQSPLDDRLVHTKHSAYGSSTVTFPQSITHFNLFFVCHDFFLSFVITCITCLTFWRHVYIVTAVNHVKWKFDVGAKQVTQSCKDMQGRRPTITRSTRSEAYNNNKGVWNATGGRGGRGVARFCTAGLFFFLIIYHHYFVFVLW